MLTLAHELKLPWDDTESSLAVLMTDYRHHSRGLLRGRGVKARSMCFVFDSLVKLCLLFSLNDLPSLTMQSWVRRLLTGCLETLVFPTICPCPDTTGTQGNLCYPCGSVRVRLLLK